MGGEGRWRGISFFRPSIFKPLGLVYLQYMLGTDDRVLLKTFPPYSIFFEDSPFVPFTPIFFSVFGR